MAMEESSAALAAIWRASRSQDAGPAGAGFAAVHREHMRGQTRHLQIDGILVDLCLARAGGTTRALNARLFKSLLDTITRPTRAGSGVKVVRQLVREMPELACHEKAMIDAVLALKGDRAFQASLFNRGAMPLTFGVFDRTEELNDLDAAMIGYDRH